MHAAVALAVYAVKHVNNSSSAIIKFAAHNLAADSDFPIAPLSLACIDNWLKPERNYALIQFVRNTIENQGCRLIENLHSISLSVNRRMNEINCLIVIKVLNSTQIFLSLARPWKIS